MAKAKSEKAYKAEIAGSGVHRIDGIVREVNDAGVVIDIKESGRIKRRPTLIPIKNIVCHAAEGAGFVIVNGSYDLEPISGTVVSEDESGVVIQDVDGVEITFPSNGAGGAKLVVIPDDDRSLKQSAVATKVQRLAEKEEDGGGRKKSKKAADEKPAKKKAGKATTGKRRSAR